MGVKSPHFSVLHLFRWVLILTFVFRNYGTAQKNSAVSNSGEKTQSTADDDSCNANTTTPSQHLSVVVIGGGLSGLATVRELRNLHTGSNVKLDVHLLEAKEDRLGGRVWTVPLQTTSPPLHIDLGGMFWHGIDNPIFEHLKSDLQAWDTIPTLGNSINPAKGGAKWIWKRRTETVELDGEWVMDTALPNLMKRWNDTMEQYARDYLQTCGDDRGNEDPPEVLRTWSSQISQGLDSDLERDLLEYQLYMAFNLDSGLSMEDHALEGFTTRFDWRESGGDDHISRHGMATLIEALTEDIQKQSCKDQSDSFQGNIHLGKRVHKIEYTATSCSVESQDGDKWIADVCVVTFPLGVLKQYHEMFQPRLDDTRLDVLQRAGVGTLNTVAVKWNRNVCNSDEGATAYNFVMERGENAYSNPLSHGFVCTGVLRGNDTSITQFHLYDTTSMDDYNNESYWKEMAAEMIKFLVPDIESSDALEVVWSNWHLDQDFLGSYSSPSTWTNGNPDREILAQPIGQSVYFAGEHTHTNGRYQSLDGAYETGQIAARALWENRVSP